MNKVVKVLMLLLVLVAIIPASAQDGAFGLSGTDLAALGAANGNSLDKDIVAFDYSVGLTVEGAGFPIDVALDGSGAWNFNDGTAFVTINGTAAGTPIEGELRIVGDYLYARAIDPTTGSDTGWFSINGAEVFESNVDFGSFGGELSDAFLEGFAEGAGVSSSDFDATAGMAALTDFAAINPEQYISMFLDTKGNQAVYTVDVSLSNLFRAEGMNEVAAQFLQATAIAPGVSAGEAAAFNALLGEVFADTIISVDQVVNTDTNLIDSASLLVSSSVDPSAIGETGSVVSVVFSLTVDLTYDVPAAVTEPVGATEIPSSVFTDTFGTAAPDTGSTGSTSSAGGQVSLDCFTSAQEFNGITGTSFTGICPASCNGSLWGTDIYTDDSSICTAAVHAGAIPASGGSVTFVIEDGMEAYPASTQNGISSSEWGSWARSFSFAGAGASAPSTSTVSFDCSTSAQEFDGGTGTTINGTCPAGCNGSLWGTNVYSDDSSICTAAVHAGAVTANGGPVTVVILDGQASYPASTQNGISSSEWGSWERSFGFEGKAGSPSNSTTGSAGGTSSFSQTASFPTGLSFGFPDAYTIMSESDVVTVVWVENTASFIQIYDMGSLFGDMDMGLQFFKDTYGGAAASTWGFTLDNNTWQETEIGGKTYSILDFEGTQSGSPASGRIVIVPLDDGGFTYVQSYAVGTPPANFAEDTLAVATSVSG